MHDYIEEVDANFEVFFTSLESGVTQVLNDLDNNKVRYKESYRRLVSLQAWQSELIEDQIKDTAIDFFREAQNDVLTSHALARQGAWRVALMSIRSSIENTLFGLFYCDHPVELAQWEAGKHKLGFSEMTAYLVRHPSFVDISEQDAGIASLKAEYTTLSKAVHGSSRLFRMTKNGQVEGLNINSASELGSWLTRERIVLAALNSILIIFFKDHLQGAVNQNLRKAISLAIPNAKHAFFKDQLGINLTET